MQFLISVPNFRGQLTPDPALPNNCVHSSKQNVKFAFLTKNW